jgi:hypothetical protein
VEGAAMVPASRRRTQPPGRRGVQKREAPVRASKRSNAGRRRTSESFGTALWEAFQEGFLKRRKR